jgi:hypothetical protein
LKFRGLSFIEIIESLKNFKKDQKLSLGAGTYKIRVSTSSLNKGKQKGFRVILLLVEVENLIAPISIYFKGDRENIKKQEIIKQAKIIMNELENL